MRKAWRIISVIVIIAIAVGAVSAGVGFLTGADRVRIESTLSERIAEKYNLDAEAFIYEWIPQSAEIIGDALFA